MTIRVGTRGSALALAQAGGIADALRVGADREVDLVPITSEGDIRNESLSVIGGTGVFAASLRRALLAGACDLVVHSLKDLPTWPVDGLRIAAVPVREDVRDALCARDGLTLADLPGGSRVGTGSPRRIAQLRSLRPDLEVVDIRGNVDTRLGFVAAGRLDAVVLARAGLERLGRTAAITETLPIGSWPTAPGQGALALEIRADDEEIAVAAGELADGRATIAVVAERQVLRGLEAGCTAPIAVASAWDGDELTVWSTVYRPDGTDLVARTVHGHPADEDAARGLGDELVTALLAAGAAELAPVGAGS